MTTTTQWSERKLSGREAFSAWFEMQKPFEIFMQTNWKKSAVHFTRLKVSPESTFYPSLAHPPLPFYLFFSLLFAKHIVGILEMKKVEDERKVFTSEENFEINSRKSVRQSIDQRLKGGGREDVGLTAIYELITISPPLLFTTQRIMIKRKKQNAMKKQKHIEKTGNIY